MPDVRRLFSTPFALEMVEDPALIESLRAAIAAERERDPTGVSQSNLGGWHSNAAMLDWAGDPAKQLAVKAIGVADTLTIDRRSPDKSRYGWAAEMWANVSGRGHANQYHVHPGCYWSAVFYVDDGYGGSDDPALGGELQLQDPRMPAVRMAAPDLAMRDADGTIQHSELTVRPKTGLLVLFPAWLQHAVRAYDGAGERITVAINLIAALKPPAAG